MVVTSYALRGGLLTNHIVSRRRLLWLWPAIGLIIGGLAIAFSQITGRSFEEVLFSGQDQLPGLVGQAGTWSLSALAWLLVFKGVAYTLRSAPSAAARRSRLCSSARLRGSWRRTWPDSRSSTPSR